MAVMTNSKEKIKIDKTKSDQHKVKEEDNNILIK